MAGMFDDLIPAPPQGKGQFDDLIPKKDAPSLMQQLFDIRNAKTGESYIYGNNPDLSGAQQGASDAYRIIADTASRGLADKLAGPEARAQTLAARERTPDYVETPTDIATAVATSPYRIGSAVLGAGIGGVEGALSAYGHQKDWVPDSEGAWDIVKGAGLGAATGGFGAKLGEWIGGSRAAKAAEAALPPPTGEALARADFVRSAQGTTRDEFARLMAGLPNATPEEAAMIAEISRKGLLTRIGESPVVRKAAMGTSGGNDMLGDIVKTAVIDHFLTGGSGLAARGVATAVHMAGNRANRVPDQAIEELATLARNGVLKLDPAIIDKWRNNLAQAGIGYARSQ